MSKAFSLIPLLFFVSFGVFAEPQIQLNDPQGIPVQLGNEQVQVLQLQEGSTYTGQVLSPTNISGNAKNLISSIGTDGVTKFSFEVAPYQTQLRLGQTTLIIQAEKESRLPLGLTTTDLILVGAVIVAVAVASIVVRQKLVNA